MDEVKAIKTQCLANPTKYLWIATKDIPEVRTIFNHLKSLEYKDKPDYMLIKNELRSIYERSMEIPKIQFR